MAASYSARVCEPLTLRIVIWPENMRDACPPRRCALSRFPCWTSIIHLAMTRSMLPRAMPEARAQAVAAPHGICVRT